MHDVPKLSIVLSRALRSRCPSCGKTKIYSKWNTLKSHCESCHFEILKDAVDILAFMYISTALITGFFLLAMFSFIPASLFLARIILGILALAAMVITLPLRKSLAIGLEFWLHNILESVEK